MIEKGKSIDFLMQYPNYCSRRDIQRMARFLFVGDIFTCDAVHKTSIGRLYSSHTEFGVVLIPFINIKTKVLVLEFLNIEFANLRVIHEINGYPNFGSP